MSADQQTLIGDLHDGLRELIEIIDMVAESLGPDRHHMALGGCVRLGRHLASGLSQLLEDDA